MQSLSNEILPAQLNIRCAGEYDLAALEWKGEYVHFRRLFADTYKQSQTGKAKICIAVIPEDHLIGQLFVSYYGARPELSDGVTRAYIYGFRVKMQKRRWVYLLVFLQYRGCWRFSWNADFTRYLAML